MSKVIKKTYINKSRALLLELFKQKAKKKLRIFFSICYVEQILEHVLNFHLIIKIGFGNQTFDKNCSSILLLIFLIEQDTGIKIS